MSSIAVHLKDEDQESFLDLIKHSSNFNWKVTDKEQAIDNLLYYLINYTSIEDSVKKSLLMGLKQAIIYDFTFEDHVKFGKYFAYYLFMNSDVLTSFQYYLDEKYQGHFRAYFVELGRTERRYGVVLKWGDKRKNFAVEEISQHTPITYVRYVPSDEDYIYQENRLKNMREKTPDEPSL